MNITTQSVSRAELLKVFEGLQNKFDFSQVKDALFKKSYKEFQKNMAQYLGDSLKNIPKENPLFSKIEAFIQEIEKTNKEWQSRIEKQDTGVAFRAGFNDSLLVFVYGKVKSGKSSLGNYMAWGHTDPTDELKEKTALQPVYFSGKKTNVKSGDTEKEAENNKEFRVGATEATSTIQGFSLAGLTWIDSPGLHSINKANGDLAKDYVEHADLILYTMKSDAPGRASDLTEIVELYRADKKLLILITGSDDTEEDCDEETGEVIRKIIMKDEQRCLAQREYVRSALEQLPELTGKTDGIEILSFSARYAQENQDCAQHFDASGMGQLFASLSKIATQQGVCLKIKTPISNFNLVLTSFIEDLDKYEGKVNEFDKPIKQIQARLPQQINEKKQVMQRELEKLLNQVFDGLVQYRDNTVKMNQEIKKLSETIWTKQRALMIDAQNDILKKVMSDIDCAVINVIKNNDLLKVPEYEIKQRIEQVYDGVHEGTRKRNRGMGSVVGGVVGGVGGFMLGGPAGAAVGIGLGSSAGGYLGGKTGNEASNKYRDITLNVGDNLFSIHQQFAEQVKSTINTQFASFEKTLLEHVLSHANNLTAKLKTEIGHLKCQLKNMASEIQEELTKLGGVK